VRSHGVPVEGTHFRCWTLGLGAACFPLGGSSSRPMHRLVFSFLLLLFFNIRNPMPLISFCVSENTYWVLSSARTQGGSGSHLACHAPFWVLDCSELGA
jgi:hypothetical protein